MYVIGMESKQWNKYIYGSRYIHKFSVYLILMRSLSPWQERELLQNMSLLYILYVNLISATPKHLTYPFSNWFFYTYRLLICSRDTCTIFVVATKIWCEPHFLTHLIHIYTNRLTHTQHMNIVTKTQAS